MTIEQFRELAAQRVKQGVRDSLGFHTVELHDLGRGQWQGQFINPRTGAREPTFVITPTVDGTVILNGGIGGPLPSKEDWVLLLEPDGR